MVYTIYIIIGWEGDLSYGKMRFRAFDIAWQFYISFDELIELLEELSECD